LNPTAHDREIAPIHRGPYRLIDSIVRYDEGTGITCALTIKGDEPYFAGHFPGHPIVPGVLELEMLFQAAEQFLLIEKTGGAPVRLASVASARFMNPIVPPRELTVSVDLKEERGSESLFSGRVADGADTFVQATFMVTVIRDL
jgi:3-hydroxyacyl-[acyl-carrier-protein] dehydratase